MALQCVKLESRLLLTEHTDILVYGSSTGAIIAAIYGAVVQDIRIIGVGVVVGALFQSVRYYDERKENIRRRRIDMVERLKPPVYQPILTWSDYAYRHVSNPIDDILRFDFGSNPDLSSNADFVSNVGETFKGRWNHCVECFKAFSASKKALLADYRNRLQTLCMSLGYGQNIDSIQLVVGNKSFPGIGQLFMNDSLRNTESEINRSNTIEVNYQDLTGRWIRAPCNNRILEAIFHPETLQNFSSFEEKKRQFAESLRDMQDYIKEVMRKGEKDWIM
jgi:hypothetical protein